MVSCNNNFSAFAVATLIVFSMTMATMAQSGHVMNGAGAVDQSMSGAGMAAPGMFKRPCIGTATVFRWILV